MAESQYLKQEMEDHPEPEYINDLRILRRFVQSGCFGYHQTDDVIFQRLKSRYSRACSAFGEERRREALERHRLSPYIGLQQQVYPSNLDKDDYIKRLERLRHVMILFKLGYGSREMNMVRVNSSMRYPDAYKAFEREIEDL